MFATLQYGEREWYGSTAEFDKTRMTIEVESNRTCLGQATGVGVSRDRHCYTIQSRRDCGADRESCIIMARDEEYAQIRMPRQMRVRPFPADIGEGSHPYHAIII